MIAFTYVAALAAANLLVFWLGPWSSPFIAFAFIGLDLSLRDRLHDRHGFIGSCALVLAAACLSYVLNPAGGRIAIASFAAFAAAGLVDGLVYSALRDLPTRMRMNGSNVASAWVDSLIFPTIAFGALMPEIVAMQFVAKVAGGAVWAWLLTRKTVRA